MILVEVGEHNAFDFGGAATELLQRRHDQRSAVRPTGVYECHRFAEMKIAIEKVGLARRDPKTEKVGRDRLDIGEHLIMVASSIAGPPLCSPLAYIPN